MPGEEPQNTQITVLGLPLVASVEDAMIGEGA